MSRTREPICIGEFDGRKCQAEATRWFDFGDEIFATCDVCRAKYDAKARRTAGCSLEEFARRQRIKVS